MSNSELRRGVVTINLEVLAQMLHFPEDHKILRARILDNDFAYDRFQILVEGPTLPLLLKGEVTPNVNFLCVQTDDVTTLVPERKIEGKFST